MNGFICLFTYGVFNAVLGSLLRLSNDFFSMARQPLGGLGRLIFRGFTITLRQTTVGRTPLHE
jgi:hypothetical protein